MRALGVPGAAAPAPDSLEPGSPAAKVGTRTRRPRRVRAPLRDRAEACGVRSRLVAPGRRTSPTVGPAIGPAAPARAEAARAEVAPEGPPGSPSPARENAPDASAASRAVSAALPTIASVAGEVAVPAEPVEPELGAAVSAARRARRAPHSLRGWRAAVAGRSWSGRALVPARAGGRTRERGGRLAAGRGRAGARRGGVGGGARRPGAGLAPPVAPRMAGGRRRTSGRGRALVPCRAGDRRVRPRWTPRRGPRPRAFDRRASTGRDGRARGGRAGDG